MRDELRYGLAAAGVTALAIALWFLFPVATWLRALADWADDLGPVGLLAYGLLFVVATLIVVPGTPLTIAGAVAFGWWALPVTLVAATIGSWLAFLAGRYLLRERLRALFDRRPAMRATVEAVGDGDLRLLTLMRLSPLVPFNVQNYALGVTDIGSLAYLASTTAGMVPGTIVCVYLGVIGRAAGGDVPGQWLLLGLGLAATVAAVRLTRRKVRAKLRAREAHARA